MVYVYVLKGAKRYVGITNNIKRRIKEHQRKASKGSQLIGEFKLLLKEEYPDYKSARKREKFLKSSSGRRWLNNLENAQSPSNSD